MSCELRVWNSDRSSSVERPDSFHRTITLQIKVCSANGGAFSYAWGSETGSDCRRRADRCGPQKWRLACLPPRMYAVLHRCVCHQSTRRVAVETGSDEGRKRISGAGGGGE